MMLRLASTSLSGNFMKDLLQRGLRVVAGVVLLAAAAVMTSAPGAAIAAGVQRDPVAVDKARVTMQAAINASRAVRRSTSGNDVAANPDRAYPPSCLNDGLPFGVFKQNPSDPAPQQQQVSLYSCSTNNPNACGAGETVTISVWRVPCSPNSAGSPQSAVLVEIDRQCGQNCGTQPVFPTFPLVLASQSNISNYPIRVANDQNTWYSTTYVNQPIYHSDIWVLENYLGDANQFDYNQAFTLLFDNTQFNVPAYNPAKYAATSQSLPISGYMTSNWYDPAHGGEGILTQVFDGGDGVTRTFTAAWYTFGTDGLPFWLFAQGSFKIGATTTGPVDTYYPSGGSFAGTGSSASFTKWGTITFSFPDCGHMVFAYNGTSGANAPIGPSGQGQRTWIRIANVNSLVCD
jgi:hypothetical protein